MLLQDPNWFLMSSLSPGFVHIYLDSSLHECIRRLAVHRPIFYGPVASLPIMSMPLVSIQRRYDVPSVDHDMDTLVPRFFVCFSDRTYALIH